MNYRNLLFSLGLCAAVLAGRDARAEQGPKNPAATRHLAHRVIKPESDDIVNAIKKKGGVVEYVVFDNEGHGFTKRENEIKGNQAILKFLDKYLKGGATPDKAGVD